MINNWVNDIELHAPTADLEPHVDPPADVENREIAVLGVQDVHDVQEEPEPPGFVCQICFAILSTKKLLKRHNKHKHTDKTFKCPHCPRVYVRQDVMKKHTKIKHNM